MGKGQQPIKINTRRGRGNLECMDEMTSFFTCMAKFMDVEDKCAAERRALTNCTTAAMRKGKQTNTINYHLQRLGRMIRR